MDSVTAFAPATVSNVACGFDVLGFALVAPGDEVTARLAPAAGVGIDDITGDHGRLPRDAAKNTAGIAAQALLRFLGERRGVALTISKGLPLSSGLGGSAASAVAAVVAVDRLFNAHTPSDTLMACAFEGERIGAGSAHGDNIAPAVYGGLVLVRVANPPDVVRLPVPVGLTAVVVHPDLEIETARARALLGSSVPLEDAIRQWANLGAFVDALHRSDFALMSRALEDAIAEPRRASLVPGLARIKRAAADAGALGCSLSGSGPSLFALCRDAASAAAVATALTMAVRQQIGGEPQTYVSPIAPHGARVTSTRCGS
ncbi:MAG: homoserine kinase [Vicinamibacterales bacterium]